MYICRKKLRSQTSDLLLEAAAGQSDVSAERERERQPREDQRRKIQEREMLGKVKHSVFPMFASSSHMDQTLVLGSQLYFSGVSLHMSHMRVYIYIYISIYMYDSVRLRVMNGQQS